MYLPHSCNILHHSECCTLHNKRYALLLNTVLILLNFLKRYLLLFMLINTGKKDKLVFVLNCHVIKTYGVVEIYLHAFLTLVSDGGQRQA